MMPEYPFTVDCIREGCGHSSDFHSLDDALNLGPNDPGAVFRCRYCDCPDMVRSEQNLVDLAAWSE